MTLGIMQPYFFPYLGYFSLIKHTDHWIFFDTVQYIERGWINRNRIIHPTKPDAMYITVPLQKHSRETRICDIKIKKEADFAKTILAQIASSYKKRAPYYNTVYPMIAKCLEAASDDIVSLNVEAAKCVCDYLKIPFHFEIFSKMNLDIEPVHKPGDWALNICKAMGADGYRNPPGGIGLFEAEKFSDANIKLEFLKINFQPYSQRKPVFLEGLSMIDAMMFLPPETISRMLDDFELISSPLPEGN